MRSRGLTGHYHRSHGSPHTRRAERRAPGPRPPNLIRVLPAQGGHVTPDNRDEAAAARGAVAGGGGRHPDVLVVGGGLIGLVGAWRPAQAGLSVAVLEAGERHAGWRAAAGMLAPI